MAKHTLIQGDSFAYNYSLKNGDDFDSNWNGTWAIVDRLGDGRQTLASGLLSLSSDNKYFELNIIPSATSSVAVGDYKLVVQLTNTSINFNKEIVQDDMKITAQGI
jgi:hypothetical protein